MSSGDTKPADKARPVTSPVVFYKDGQLPDSMHDWRPKAVPADAPEPNETEEEVAPKAESAPAPVESYKSPEAIEPDHPVNPVPPPAEKDNGPRKVTSPGKPTSSGPAKPTTPSS